MIGWWIVIAAQTPQERDAAATENRRAATLAQWEVGPGGLDWVAELVEAGKANQISEGGYPNRYAAKAGDVLLLLTSGPPAHTEPAIIGDDYVMSANWHGKVEVHAEKMAACAPDLLLTIDAWDQS